MTPSTRFRLFLMCSTFAALALLARLSMHVSFHARVLGRYSIPYFTLLVGVAATSLTTVLLHHPFFYRRVHRFRWPAVLTIASAVMLVFSAELGTRVLNPLGISHIQEGSRLWLAYVPDPDLVFRLPAHFQGTFQGVTVSTNALGFRDREIEPRQEGELRILLLGDSITFGYGVPIEQTYGRKLESILTARLNRPVRTFNGGMGGFNTVQEYAFLAKHAAAIDPDVVTVLYLANDIALEDPKFDSRAAIYEGESRIMRFLIDRSWLFRLAYFGSSTSETARMASGGLLSRGVTDSFTALAKMADLCREHGFQFRAFYYREADDPRGAKAFADELFSRLATVGAENGFDVTDIGPWWANNSRRSITTSVIDWHPNARGHDILAAGIAKELMSHGALQPSRENRHSTQAAGDDGSLDR